MVAAYHFQAIPRLGTLPVVPVVAASTLVLVVVSLLTASSKPHRSADAVRGQARPRRPRRRLWVWTAAFGALFVLGNDFWAWNDARLGPLGFPWWVWYSLALCGITAVAFWCFSRVRPTPRPSRSEFGERFSE